MISFPSLSTFKGCNPIFLIDHSDDHGLLLNSVVNVTIKLSATRSLEFSLPGHIVIERENEMKHVANTLMHLEWKGSLIMQEIVRKKLSRYHNSDRKQVSIVLVQPQDSNFASIAWSPALKKSIELFYKDGIISVFNNCSARDLIMVLNFLSIQYTAKHLSFESFGSYLSFKLWSDYFIYREPIATWIKKSLISNFSKHRYIFVTNPENLGNASIYFQGQICEHLDGGLNLAWNNNTKKSNGVPNSCKGECKTDTI